MKNTTYTILLLVKEEKRGGNYPHECRDESTSQVPEAVGGGGWRRVGNGGRGSNRRSIQLVVVSRKDGKLG